MKNSFVIAAAIFLMFMPGCKPPVNYSPDSDAQEGTESYLQLDLSTCPDPTFPISAKSVVTSRGENEKPPTVDLVIRNLDTGEVELLGWPVIYDDINCELDSKQALVLFPGRYEFSVDMDLNGHLYFGTRVTTVSEFGTDIFMSLMPLRKEKR